MISEGQKQRAKKKRYIPSIISKQIFQTSRSSVLPSVRTSVRHTFIFLIPAVILQNDTDKSCLECVESVKHLRFRHLGIKVRIDERVV